MRHILGSLILGLMLLPGVASAYDIDKKTFSILPPHCQAKYASMYKMGKVKGISLANPDKYHPRLWAKRIGNPWAHFHHYCPALAGLHKAKFATKKKAYKLGVVSQNILYTIKHSKFTPSNMWVLAEAQMYMGEISDDLNKPGDAITWYYKSLKSNPKSYRTYIGLASVLKKAGNYKEALKVIRQGRKKLPKSKSLRRQEERILKKLKK